MIMPRGFTLIEMLAAIAVISMVSAMILFNYTIFNRQIVMNRAARALAFGLREAQSRSVNVSQVQCSPAPCFPRNFGVHMETATNGEFVLFTDRDGDGIYDASGTCGGASDECVIRTLFTNGVHVQELRTPSAATEAVFNVLFYRPDPTVIVYNTSGVPLGGTSNGPFRIFLAPQGYTGPTACLTPGICKVIRIWLTGQISIEQ